MPPSDPPARGATERSRWDNGAGPCPGAPVEPGGHRVAWGAARAPGAPHYPSAFAADAAYWEKAPEETLQSGGALGPQAGLGAPGRSLWIRVPESFDVPEGPGQGRAPSAALKSARPCGSHLASCPPRFWGRHGPPRAWVRGLSPWGSLGSSVEAELCRGPHAAPLRPSPFWVGPAPWALGPADQSRRRPPAADGGQGAQP